MTAKAMDVAGTIQACTLASATNADLTIRGMQFTGLTPDREAHLAGVMGVALKEVERRLADAGHAVLALAGEEIAGYGWVLDRMIRISELDLQVRLPEGHIYIWDCLTLPHYRGRGIFPALLRHLVNAQRERGVEQAWAATAPGNESSIRAFAKAGFRLVARTYGARGTFSARPTPRATPEEAALLRTILPLSPHHTD